MGNNHNKSKLRRSRSVPDTQSFMNDSLHLRNKSQSTAQLTRLLSYKDIRKALIDADKPFPLPKYLFLPEFPFHGDLEDRGFEIISVIAKGAYGNVLKVYRNELRQFYAIKVLQKEQIVLQDVLQQCKDEACIQSVMGSHPFIVQVLEFWQGESYLYMALPYIPYGDMFTLWSYHGYFPEELVRYHVAELALALSYLHKCGVIYRDMKMENILFDQEGHIQITDFGLAKWLNLGEMTRTVCGTLQYMAPEVLSVKMYDHRADWWSLGILMYTMLVGEYPIDGAEDHYEMSECVSICEYELPDYITDKCALVVSRLLTKCHIRRLSDVFSLQNLPFFKGIDFNALVDKQISPRDLVPENFFDVSARSEGSYTYNESTDEFSGFDDYVDDYIWHLPPDVVPVFV